LSVFERRLKVHEELYALVDRSQDLANQLFDDEELDEESRHTIWSSMVREVARFADANGLYLNDEVMLHCMMMLIGTEEIPSIEDADEREAAKREFRVNARAAREMIAEESGMSEVNKVLRRIAKSGYKSELVESARQIHERYDADSS
jgi:hypothetical protein